MLRFNSSIYSHGPWYIGGILMNENQFTHQVWENLQRDGLYQALVSMIQWSHYIQKRIKSYGLDLSPLSLLKEYHTTHFRTARQSGHTTMINRLCNELYKGDAFVIVPRRSQKDILKEMRSPHKFVGHTIVTVSQLDSLRGMNRPSVIIVDCASYLSKEDMDKIYEFASAYIYPGELFDMLLME